MIKKLLILLFFLIPAASAYWISDDKIDPQVNFYLVNVSPEIIEPGQTTLLNITLKNLAPAIAVNVNATLDPDDISPIDVVGIRKKYIDSKIKGAEKADAFMGVIQNEDIKLSLPVYVNQNVSEGVYNVPLVLSWEDKIRVHWSQTLYMGIQIKGKHNVRVAKISTTPVELRPDTENDKVIIKVENTGKTTAKSVKLNLDLKEPFSEAYSGSSSDFISQIPPDESNDFIISLDIDKNAVVGEYTLPLKITYRAHEGDYDLNDNIKIRISNKADFEEQNITTSPSVILPGDDFTINILIKNVGQEKAANVKAVINTKSFFTGVKTDYLGEMKVGESKIATFELTADRDTIPDNYENDLKLIWSDGDDRLEKIKSFGITVSKRKEGSIAGSFSLFMFVLVGIIGTIVVFRKKIFNR